MLGATRIRANNAVVRIRGKLKRRLVSRLALARGARVDADTLIEAMWNDGAPRTARQSLHVHISHLREALADASVTGLITTVDGGYTLGLPVSNVDVTVFEHHVEAGTVAARHGDLRAARAHLTDSLELWDAPFDDLADCPAAVSERYRLHALHEHAVDELHEVMLGLDDEHTVPRLRAVVAERPLRERPYEQLIRVLIAHGDRAAATAVHQQAAATFRSELGVAPSRRVAAALEHAQPPAPRRSAPPATRIGDALDEAGGCLLYTAAAAADLTGDIAGLAQRAGQAGRGFDRARVSPNDGAPFAPLLPLASITSIDTVGFGGRAREVMFDEITHGITARLGRDALVVIDGADRAPASTIDYFASFARRPTPSFTLVLIARDAADELGARLGIAVRPIADVPTTSPATSSIDPLQLGPDGGRMLRCLHAATLPVPTEVVVRASGLGADTARLALQLLLDAGVATAEPGAHLNLTDGAHQAVDDPLLHQRLADAIERALDPADPYRLVALARHRLLADPTSTTARTAAADAAAHLDAVGAYRELSELLDLGHYDDLDAPGALGLLISLGRARVRAGDLEAGAQSLRRALRQARSVDDADAFATATRALAEETAPQTSRDDTQALVREALDRLPIEPTDTRVQLQTDLANSHLLGDIERADALATEAVELARGGTPGTLARALTGLVQARMRPDNPSERLALALEAQELARRDDVIETLVLALSYEACALMEQGQLARAEPPLRYANALAGAVQVPRFQWWGASWHALLDFACGTSVGGARFRHAYALWPSANRPDAFECYASQVAMLRLYEGRGGELAAAITETATSTSTLGYRGPAAFCVAQGGDLTTARELLEPLLEPGALESIRDISLTTTLATAAEAAFLCEHTAAGDTLAASIAPYVDQHAVLNLWGGGGFYWGSLRHAYGLAVALTGDRSGAVAALDRATRDNLSAGAPGFAKRSAAIADALRAA